MSEFSPADELITAAGDAELQALELVVHHLAAAEVDITITNCNQLLLNSLPDELSEPLTQAASLPTTKLDVARFDMRLAYDREHQHFHPSDIFLGLDNGMSLAFNLHGQVLLEAGQRIRTYKPRIVNTSGEPLLDYEQLMRVEVGQSLVSELLAKLGVTIPESSERANWEDIRGILFSSNRWSAVASKIVSLGMNRQLYIEERYDGRGYTGDKEIDLQPDPTNTTIHEVIAAPYNAPLSDIEAPIPSPVPEDLDNHLTEITIALDEATSDPDRFSSLKFVLLSEEADQQPRTAAFERVQVIYTADAVSRKPQRHELGETRKFALPSLGIIRHLSTAMGLAQLLD